MMKNHDFLQSHIDVHFRDKKLLENVFIHRSYLNENRTLKLISNEKLEFLGDSVLSLITSVYLYRHYPHLTEGDYTEIKAAIVRTESLAIAASQLKLGDYLLLSHGQDREAGRENKNILADSFEALIGAIFIDAGFDTAYTFVNTFLFGKKLKHIIDKKLYLSPKSRLQEYTQARFKVPPLYRVEEENGPEHLKTYKIGVFINKKKFGSGLGKSKKEAEELAAKKALEKLDFP